MPKPAQQGDDPEVEIRKPSTPEPIQVDLEERPKAPEKTPEKTPDPDAEERRWKALESQVAATRRINEDLRKQLATVSERLVAPAPAVDEGAKVLPKGTTQETIDQYDQLVSDGKWQDAVRLLAREEYRVSRQAEQAEDEINRIEQRRLDALERSKQKVESLYPTLHRQTGDPESPETQLFNEAVADLSNADEQFLHDPYAPELAMRRMEELAQERGLPLARAGAKTMPPVRRAGQTSMPVSRGAGGATTYSMTPEQKEWCDRYLGHLPEADRYKHYAKFAKMTETTGGVDA